MKERRQLVSNRDLILLALIMLGFVLLAARAAHLQVFFSADLQAAGSERYARNELINPNRGVITDRRGETLALSTAVDSAWADPGILVRHPERLDELAAALDLPDSALKNNLERYAGQNRQFMYLRRHLTSQRSSQLSELNVPGVSLKREYRRFYPHGPITASLLGVTDIDDQGIEGIEFTRDAQLKGKPGTKKVIKDRRGRTVEFLHETRVEDGIDLRLSIDARIQQLVYKELLAVLTKERAAHATSVVVHIPTGEILAIATAPSFNPNLNSDWTVKRNQAASDVFEPGSIAKPFLVAKALMQGIVTPKTVIDTSPGFMHIDGYMVEDIRNYGPLSVEDILKKSSNIGMIKMALQLDPNELTKFYRNVGFGTRTASGLPGDVAGLVPTRNRWSVSEQATLSYGYGFAVNALQIVQAYAAIANEGVLVPIVIFPDDERTQPRRVMPQDIAVEMKRMLERAVTPTGTARRAKIPLYRVAGKTATVQKLIDGEYSSEQHIAMFVGFAPASKPELAAVVIVDDPKGKINYGGVVAAPVFRKIVSSALRILNVSPDDLETTAIEVATVPHKARS
ncbi:MAG: penicillin-binding protein 2 [Acidiferrobacterales bacterium]|nr:penicillin-binding protein 2 [Acidiferrobacterales bacterium]